MGLWIEQSRREFRVFDRHVGEAKDELDCEYLNVLSDGRHKIALEDLPQVVQYDDNDIFSACLLSTLLSEDWSVDSWIQKLHQNQEELPGSDVEPMAIRPRLVLLSTACVSER